MKEPVGALLVRAWLQEHALVARLSMTPDVETVPPETIVVTTLRDVQSCVVSWLEEMGYVGDTPDETGD